MAKFTPRQLEACMDSQDLEHYREIHKYDLENLKGLLCGYTTTRFLKGEKDMESNMGCKENRLSIIEKRLYGLRDAVSELEALSDKLKGGDKQLIPPGSKEIPTPIRSFDSFMKELPDQLGLLIDRISMVTETITVIIY